MPMFQIAGDGSINKLIMRQKIYQYSTFYLESHSSAVSFKARMDEALESSLDPLRTASIFFEEIRENAISEAFLKIRQIISTYETLNRRYIEPHRYYVPAPETSEHLPSVELNSAERSFTLNELEDFDLNLEEDNHELLEEMSNDDERFWITSAPRRVSNHLSGILSVSRGQFLSTLVALSLELELVSPWALRLCSAVPSASTTSVLVSQHR